MPRLIDTDALDIRKYTRWFDDTNDKRAVERMIREAPTIDPVHAAGGCYCGECGYLWSDVFDDDLFYCHYWGYSICEDDYCSRGERREENESGTTEQ